MEATTFLCNDHRKVEQLFRDYQTMATSETSTAESKRMCVDKLIAELSIHASLEEQKLYPLIKQRVSDVTDLVNESLQEHQQVQEALAELQLLNPDDGAYDERVHALISEVKHHAQQEEHGLFPELRAECSVQELQHLGQELEEAKAMMLAERRSSEVIREEVRAPERQVSPS